MSAEPARAVRALRHTGEWAWARLANALGGPANRRVVVLLACVLALNGADLGTIGAIAAPLEDGLKIGNTQLSLLVALPMLLAALATIPIGALSDRLPRIRLLAGSIVLWSLAMLAGSAAVSFQMLLISRLFLGAVQATSGPTLFSLTGDFFPPGERARMWSFIAAGELLGTAFGFIVSGSLAAISWRLAFVVLAIPTLALAVALWRVLPEPARGASGQLAEGAEDLAAAERAPRRAADPDPDPDPAPQREDTLTEQQIAEQEVEPDPDVILHEDPDRLSLRDAIRYVLRIRTNVRVIIASALAYFFLGGGETFGEVFIRGQYGLGQVGVTSAVAVLGIGAIAGTLLSGRIADHLLRRGRLSARVVVPAVAFGLAALGFIIPITTHSLALGLPLFVLAAAGLAGAQPPLDAARLDIIPARLWGRAEGIRTALRTLTTAAAPVAFGLLAQLFGASSRAISSAQSGSRSASAAGSAQGLQYTFLIMLMTLVAAGLVLLRATRTYPHDAAAAIASDHRAGRAKRFQRGPG